MKHCLDAVAKLLIERHVACKGSDVKKASFTQALKYLLVHSINRGGAAIVVELHQSNATGYLSIKRDKAVLYEVARMLENACFSTTISGDRLVRAIYTTNVVKTLRDAASSIEFKGG